MGDYQSHVDGDCELRYLRKRVGDLERERNDAHERYMELQNQMEQGKEAFKVEIKELKLENRNLNKKVNRHKGNWELLDNRDSIAECSPRSPEKMARIRFLPVSGISTRSRSSKLSRSKLSESDSRKRRRTTRGSS